ncbi:hypothetical protein DV736_g1103, partial [Chaetothyriales sp. CBS 134916]
MVASESVVLLSVDRMDKHGFNGIAHTRGTPQAQPETMSWFAALERKAVEALLRNPSFRHGVQRVHQAVYRLQHGKSPEYYQGGTHIDEQKTANQGLSRFLKLFWEELKTGHKPEPKR